MISSRTIKKEGMLAPNPIRMTVRQTCDEADPQLVGGMPKRSLSVYSFARGAPAEARSNKLASSHVLEISWRGRPALASRGHLGLAWLEHDAPNATEMQGQDALATKEQGQDGLATSNHRPRDLKDLGRCQQVWPCHLKHRLSSQTRTLVFPTPLVNSPTRGYLGSNTR